MIDYIQENKRSIFLLSLLFFVLAAVLYIMLIRPMTEDISRKEKNIATAETNIHQLEQEIERIRATPEEIDIEELLLEKVIPTEQKLDEYLLSLQLLEYTTNSQIDHIDFVYDSSIDDHEQAEEDEEQQPDTTEADGDEPETIGDADSNESDDEAHETPNESEEDSDTSAGNGETDTEQSIVFDPTFIFEKPENLHVMTVRLSVVSPSFDDFIDFLEAIEDQERLSFVSQLRFDTPTEEEELFAEDPSEDIPFEIELTTFYYEK